MNIARRLAILLCIAAIVPRVFAATTCVNKFRSKSEGPRQVVTLLTGKLTFQEAQALVESISSKQSPPIEWVDDKGKSIAKQFGDAKVVRPMPVGCDGKTSGVVMVVTFPTGQQPSTKMQIKLDASGAVTFEQQKD
ncbi:MAG TPA: hypothetical protein VN181_06815 [Thermoanaerobaculia bacterium]|nr:hypothetical protein [Thermoanaerobaculia bacterium]